MESDNQLALFAEPTETPAPVTIGIGEGANNIVFDADPADGTIHISAARGAELTLDADDFHLVAEILLRAAVPE